MPMTTSEMELNRLLEQRDHLRIVASLLRHEDATRKPSGELAAAEADLARIEEVLRKHR